MKKELGPSSRERASIFVRYAIKATLLLLFFLGLSFAPATYAQCACDSPLVTLQPTRYPLPSDGSGPQTLAVGDVNEDGKNDLLLANYNSSNVSVMFGNGSGGFTAASSSTGVTEQPRAIVARDFNGDGHLDFATINQGVSPNPLGLSIRYGNGSGIFAGSNVPILVDPNNSTSARLRGYDIAVIDFDHTGSPDLAIAIQGQDGVPQFNRIALFRNVGGAFTQIDNVNVNANPFDLRSISVADFNNDGWDDMATVRSPSFSGFPNLFVLLNNHLGGWSIANYDVGTVNLISSAATDYDRDGDVDLLVAAEDQFGGGLWLYRNNGSGTLTSTASSGFLHLARVTTADVDMDGFGDFLVTIPNGGVGVLLGNHAAALGATVFSTVGSQSTNQTGAGDFNGDGKPDLALPGAGSNDVSVMLNTNNLNAIRKTDYNGDGRTDLAIWRPSDGNWWIRHSYFGTITVPQFGASSDVPVPGDYDGDNKTDLAIFRPGDNTWYIIRSSNNTFYGIGFGLGTDKFVPGDYDGDCKTDLAVWRPSDGTWYIIRSSNNSYTFPQWGTSGDIPVPGDYDGDCKTDVAVFRPSTGAWWVMRSSNGSSFVQQWGQSGDKTVQGDYDGDGKTDIAIWHPADGTWWILQSTDGISIYQFGTNGDLPQPGDYDGDGHTDACLRTPGSGIWHIRRSSDNQLINQQWGVSADVPVSAPYQIQ